MTDVTEVRSGAEIDGLPLTLPGAFPGARAFADRLLTLPGGEFFGQQLGDQAVAEQRHALTEVVGIVFHGLSPVVPVGDRHHAGASRMAAGGSGPLRCW